MTGPTTGRRRISVADLRKGDEGVERLIHWNRVERWRPVVGYEDFYEVSDLGRIKSVARVITHSNGHPQRWPERILKQHIPWSGRLSVRLYRNGKAARVAVHHLMAEAFIGPRPESMQVLHWNDHKDDNRAENLRYGSAADNIADQVRNGLHHVARRTHCPQGHPYDETNTRLRKDGARV